MLPRPISGAFRMTFILLYTRSAFTDIPSATGLNGSSALVVGVVVTVVVAVGYADPYTPHTQP
ncbi:hypothetical protein E2C01_009791 [Portunus trituberculatus]|uniref:Uncharacterized protein n=1 Tax=Portunus trituberculatus TaxID=210409 RepID=A0A5B7D6N4_PORTR|nr:hypothetical protein [Portunus trituberculatus]